MRRIRPLPPQKLFRGREFGRLMTMLLMLGVLWMMVTRASDPGVWRWLANDPDGGKKTAPPDDDVPATTLVAPGAEKYPDPPKATDAKPPSDQDAAAQGAAPAVAQAPAAQDFERVTPGPTDQDEEEWDAAKEEFQAITDREALVAIDMPSYWRQVKWAQAQTFDQLWKRAKTVSYVQLWEQPEKYRGKLIRMKMLHLRQAFEWEATKNAADIKVIYDARGWTEDSKVFPYIVLFCDKPPKLPLGSDIFEEATFVGYFLKQMSYRDGLDIRRAAPLLIGRLRWQENVARAALRSNRDSASTLWPVMVGGVLVLLVIVGSWIYRARNPRKRRELVLAPVDDQAVENWMDKIGQDESEQELQTRNGRTKYAGGRETDAKPLDWTDPGLHDETFPGFHEDSK